MDFIDKVKGFLFEPSNTFHNSREDSFDEQMIYYIVLYLFYSVFEILVRIFFGEMIVSLMGKYAMFSVDAGIKEIIMNSLSDVISAITGLFLIGAFLHIGVYIAGGRNGLNRTIKALVYSSTPSLLFGWIPVINIMAGLWSLILNIMGLREFQEISKARALLAIVIPFILLVLLEVILIKAIFLPGIKIPVS